MKYAFSTGEELISLCEAEQITIAEVMIRHQLEIDERSREDIVNEMFENLMTMQRSVSIGFDENQQFRRRFQQGTEIPIISGTAF